MVYGMAYARKEPKGRIKVMGTSGTCNFSFVGIKRV